MKKILALMMAIVMMMAIAVPAFAESTTLSITKDDPAVVDGAQTTNADIVTKNTKSDGTDAYYYTVTFPASTEIGWNETTEYDITYSVESQLLLGASLDISVTEDATDGNVMKLVSDPTSEFQLKYTLTGGNVVTNFEEVNDAGTKPATAVKVAIKDFSGVPVAAYKGAVTYTVVYNAPTTA